MSSRALQILAAVLVVVALTMAYLAYQVSRQMTVSTAGPAGPAQGQEMHVMPQGKAVVVALRALEAQRLVDDTDVGIRQVPVAPERAYTDVTAVVGRPPLVDIDPGVPLTPRYFSDISPMSQVIPEGHKAVSIALDEVIGVGGHLQPGDWVDVVAFLRTPGVVGESQASTILQKALVLAVSDQILSGAPDSGGEAGPARRRQQTAVLAVPGTEVSRVVLASAAGDVRLALRRKSRSAMLSPPENFVDAPSATSLADLLGVSERRKPANAAGVTIHRGDNVDEVSP